jgi:hypothetical protein
MVKAQERTSGLPAANGPARNSSETLAPDLTYITFREENPRYDY